MPYRHLEHEADMGIEGIGATIEEAFQQGALAMFAVQVEPESVDKRDEIAVKVSAEELGELFVELLNELLAQADLNDLVLAELHIDELKETDGGWELRGKARGEPINRDKQQLKTEVKAATYSGLSLTECPDGYHIQCVLDI